jgi:hypothetical protein
MRGGKRPEPRLKVVGISFAPDGDEEQSKHRLVEAIRVLLSRDGVDHQDNDGGTQNASAAD